MAIELITGHAGSSHIDSADFGAFNAGVVGPGIYILDGCECTVTSANSVLVAAGDLLCEGRHTRITGTGETLTLANGMSGYKRNDIVAAHYVKDGAGVESVTLTIVKGTAATGGQVDPAMPATGKVLEGATDAYWPLYRIVIDDLTPQTPEKLAGENPIVSTSGGNALPIANGGTGADSVEDALTNLGIKDHVIDTGTSTTNGSWSWIKFDSGFMILSGGWNAYKSTAGVNAIDLGGFPVSFVSSKPMSASFSVLQNGFSNAWQGISYLQPWSCSILVNMAAGDIAVRATILGWWK